jgi:hypothetical protein
MKKQTAIHFHHKELVKAGAVPIHTRKVTTFIEKGEISLLRLAGKREIAYLFRPEHAREKHRNGYVRAHRGTEQTLEHDIEIERNRGYPQNHK